VFSVSNIHFIFLPLPLVFGLLCLVSGVRVSRFVFMLSLPLVALCGKTSPPSLE
jgi:hypothetical protein